MRHALPALLKAALVVLMVGGATSCRSTSVAYRFAPSPLETLVQPAEDGPIVARVLVGIPGAEREGRSTSGHPQLLVRMRIENKAEEPIEFDPARAILLGSDLAPFGPALLETSEPTRLPVRVDGGDSLSMLLRFPFPQDGSLDAPLLTGVNLQFELGRPSGNLEVSVGLERDQTPTLRDNNPPVIIGGGYYWGAGPGWWGRW